MIVTRQSFENEKDLNEEAYLYSLTLQGDLQYKDEVPTVGSLPLT